MRCANLTRPGGSPISKLAQAKARLKSAEGQHDIQLRQRNDLNEQLEKCMIRATKPGLVVYGGNREEFYGGEERVREGAAVRERQVLITIPDMRQMSVNVKIHESYIKKIKKGQKARITVDAFPDTILKGEVTKVGVLPDSQNRWLNPDMKVYVTTVAIQDTEEWVKPGMSAKVEILVNRLEDCTYVPLQAVSPEAEKQVCYVARGGSVEKREVQIGEFNDEFIQIKSGVSEGEQVLLRRPNGDGARNGRQKAETGRTAKGRIHTHCGRQPAGEVLNPANVCALPYRQTRGGDQNLPPGFGDRRGVARSFAEFRGR